MPDSLEQAYEAEAEALAQMAFRLLMYMEIRGGESLENIAASDTFEQGFLWAISHSSYNTAADMAQIRRSIENDLRAYGETPD